MPDTEHPHAHADHRENPSQETVLAALARARQHDPRDISAVAMWAILEHLHISRRSHAARAVRRVLDELHADGLVTRSRRGGIPTWALTEAAETRLARIDGAALPESPQHQAWRNARTAAAQEIGRFRARLQAGLDAAALLLDAHPPPHSDAWLEVGELLHSACWRVASASHCLHEWVEPDEGAADVDDRRESGDERFDDARQARLRALRAGRRNIRLWDQEPR